MLPMLEDHREIDMTKAMHVPIGLASPLWWPFAAAAGAGLTFWWMTRWTRAANLEALAEAFAPPLNLPAAPAPAVVVLEEAADQVEAASKTVAEATEALVSEAETSAEPAAPKKKPKPTPEAPLH